MGCATSKASDQPAHTHSLIRAFACCLEYSISVKLLTEHHLEFLSFKGGCTVSSESTLVKMQIVGNLMPRLNYIISEGSGKTRAVMPEPSQLTHIVRT